MEGLMTGSTSAYSKMLPIWQTRRDQERLQATWQDTALGNTFISYPTSSAVHRSLNLSQNILHCSSHHQLSSLTVVHKASPQPKQTKFQPKVCFVFWARFWLLNHCTIERWLCSQIVFTAVIKDSNSGPESWQKTHVKSYLHVHRNFS